MWKICIEERYMNCEKIYPIQQKKVRRMLDELLPNKNIEKIIIFGSSVTDRCHIDSDIDIYVKLKEKEEKLIKRYIPFIFDLWTNYTVDERLEKEIIKKGIIVYESK